MSSDNNFIFLSRKQRSNLMRILKENLYPIRDRHNAELEFHRRSSAYVAAQQLRMTKPKALSLFAQRGA
jgi:hypothetical protein